MNESKPLEKERLILEKENIKEMNEGSVIKRKINHSITAIFGGRLEVRLFSA
jgi:hypothetical protein